MNTGPSQHGIVPISKKNTFLIGVLTILTFHLSFFPGWGVASVVFLAGIWLLSTRGELVPRRPFDFGIVFGFCLYAPQLQFFWTIFGAGSLALWMVLAFWMACYFHSAQRWAGQLEFKIKILLIPCLWIGFEYFRSELYPLRFSWAIPGYALAHTPVLLPGISFGVYGYAFVVLGIFSVMELVRLKSRWMIFHPTLWVLAWIVSFYCSHPANQNTFKINEIHVGGVQLEFPGPMEITRALDQLIQKHPNLDLILLSEYTLDGPVEKNVLDWCKKNQRYLIVGGKDPLPDGKFYNTAFVVGPSGNIVFKQAKSVPIQFFKDGLPAPEQNVWASPWGPLGICVCYDLSYTRITDTLIRKGVQALLVPTMDVETWGASQHILASKVAPVRAREYGVPIFRLCSSGISQLVDRDGKVTAEAPFPGQEHTIAGSLRLDRNGRLPPDRYLVWVGVIITVFLALYVLSTKQQVKATF